MWQVAVAAAVAGSGIIAKHLFSPNSPTSQTEPKQEVQEQPDLYISNIFTQTQNWNNHNGSENASRSAIDGENGVFWFTSSKPGRPSRSQFGLKKSRCSGKKLSGTGKNDRGSVYQRKRVCLRMKRRKISRNSSVKCDSSISNGKADISKLSSTIEETAKVVQELKSELNKETLAHSHQQLNFDNSRKAVNTIQKPVAGQVTIEPCPLRHPVNSKIVSYVADSCYASSVLTEEQQHECAEMDLLEAELEFELQKLPWCTTETSENLENMTDLAQSRILQSLIQTERHEAMNQSLTSYQSDGVPPAELQIKLSILLIEQQESHISELESELNLAHSKFQEKEAELRALKDCVRRLTELDLSTRLDEEKEVYGEEQCSELEQKNTLVADHAMVGMKRAMHFRS